MAYQLKTLSSTQFTSSYNDFYVFRYLASQGFLPGYSFPTQPLLAWVPDDNGSTIGPRQERGDWLSRARFLGISEFGPGNVIYHNGGIYSCDSLKLSAGIGLQGSGGQSIKEQANIATRSIAVCSQCGHYVDNLNLNVCPNCKAELKIEDQQKGLYRVLVVETKKVERITVADEERRRLGFDLRTFYHFDDTSSVGRKRRVSVTVQNLPTLELFYGDSAKLMRVNFGWRKNAYKESPGFDINFDTGSWLEKPKKDEQDKYAGLRHRILPFVTDTRNVLIIDFKPFLSREWNLEAPELQHAQSELMQIRELRRKFMTTAKAALSRAIAQHFQIELSEIFVEPLPNADKPTQLLIYESGEGGSGVLKRLCTSHLDTSNGSVLSAVANTALKIMHYDKGEADEWQSGRKAQRAADKKPECVACYDCLLTYYNQPDHAIIDRRMPQIYDFFVALTHCHLEQVGKSTSEESTSPLDITTSEGRLAQWLKEQGFIDPDKMPWHSETFAYDFTAYFSPARVVVVFEALSDELKMKLDEMAISYMELNPNDETSWEQAFAPYHDLLQK